MNRIDITRDRLNIVTNGNKITIRYEDINGSYSKVNRWVFKYDEEEGGFTIIEQKYG